MIHPGSTVLFQGDSITNAFRMPNEINDAYQMGAGYAMLVAATVRAARPADRIRFVNRGVSGDRVVSLAARWQADCLDLRPDMVSLLVGINDTAHHVGGKPGASVAEFAADYRGLLEMTRLTLPGVRLVLGEPFTLVAGGVTEDWVRDLALRQAVVRQLAGEFGAMHVPFQSAFDAAVRQAPADYWIYDGIHPTAAGFGLMARLWLACVEENGCNEGGAWTEGRPGGRP